MRVFNSFQEVLAVNNFYGQDKPSLKPEIVPKVGVSIDSDKITDYLQYGLRERASWEKLKQDARVVTGQMMGFGMGGEIGKAYQISFNTGTGALTIEGVQTVVLPVNPVDAAIADIQTTPGANLIHSVEKVIWDYVNANLDKIEWERK